MMMTRLKDWQQVEARRNRLVVGGQPQPQAAAGAAGAPSSCSGGGKELLALVEIVKATGRGVGRHEEAMSTAGRE